MHLKIVYHGDIYFDAEDRQVGPRYFGQNEAKYGVSEPLGTWWWPHAQGKREQR